MSFLKSSRAFGFSSKLSVSLWQSSQSNLPPLLLAVLTAAFITFFASARPPLAHACATGELPLVATVQGTSAAGLGRAIHSRPTAAMVMWRMGRRWVLPRAAPVL